MPYDAAPPCGRRTNTISLALHGSGKQGDVSHVPPSEPLPEAPGGRLCQTGPANTHRGADQGYTETRPGSPTVGSSTCVTNHCRPWRHCMCGAWDVKSGERADGTRPMAARPSDAAFLASIWFGHHGPPAALRHPRPSVHRPGRRRHTNAQWSSYLLPPSAMPVAVAPTAAPA